MGSVVVNAGSRENFLLIEGGEDKHVFTQLLQQHQVFDQLNLKQERLEFKVHDGIDNLLKLRVLRNYVVVDEARRFGIVIDADEDFAVRWN